MLLLKHLDLKRGADIKGIMEKNPALIKGTKGSL